MMKKAQQMRTMLPMGLRDEMSVSTTSFRPGARLMTLEAARGRGTVSPQPCLETAPTLPRVTRAEKPGPQVYVHSRALCPNPIPLRTTPHYHLETEGQKRQRATQGHTEIG